MRTKADLYELARINADAGPRTPHLIEYVSVTAFFALCALVVRKLWVGFAFVGGWNVAGAVLLGYLAADFTSGLVHWLFDTWGSPDTPVLGKAFIVPFRIHHVDPKDITRHGFIATNGHNCLVSLPALAGALAVPLSWTGAPVLVTFLLALCLGVFGTNQFHKWAHQDRVNGVIAALQRSGLILGIAHHDVHHHAPYEDNYCITSGWLNAPLRRLRFFRVLESIIVRTTRAQPRRDDLATAAPAAH